MIFTGLYSLVINFLILLMSPIPEIKALSGISDLFEGVFKFFGYVSLFVDFKVMASCLGFILLFSNANLIFNFCNWLYHKLPFVG